MTSKEYIYAYLYNLRNQSEEDIKALQNSLRFRSVGVVDCVEFLCAIQRLETIIEISSGVLGILNRKK